MNKIIILICGLFLSLTVLSDEWPHENISNAVFALDIEDRVPINIVEEGDNSLGKIYFFTNIRNLSGERILIVGFTKVESWLMLVLILMACDGVYGHQKTCGILG